MRQRGAVLYYIYTRGVNWVVVKMADQTLETCDTLVIQPTYQQAYPNEPIKLGRHSIKIDSSHEDADVELRFLPNNRLIIMRDAQTMTASDLAAVFGRIDGGKQSLALVDRGIEVQVIANSLRILSPSKSAFTATKPSSEIRRCIVHLFNFPDFFSPTDYILRQCPTPDRSISNRIGRLHLCAGGWNLTISGSDRTSDACGALKEQGGWNLTHVGEITREDGSDYTTEDLLRFLDCTYYFFSFVLGRWAGCSLPVGYDSKGAVVFEEWGMRRLDADHWRGTASCFDEMHGEFLAEVFPGFWNLWTQELWRGALSKAIYWYVSGCSGGPGFGVDNGLVLAQSALELLAWKYCVKDRKMISKEAFSERKLSAADRFRILLSLLNIPLDIPQGLRPLQAKRGQKWVDGPDVITQIRNGLVHPTEDEELPDGAFFHAWKLSLWYLDLIILRLCKYEGKYACRLDNGRWVGTVENVPWFTT